MRRFRAVARVATVKRFRLNDLPATAKLSPAYRTTTNWEEKMKKMWLVTFAIFCFVGIASKASAGEVVRIWQEVSVKEFTPFYNAMQKNGWANKTGISVDGLSTVAFSHAVEKSLAEKGDEKLYKELFQKWNGLTGESITSVEFRAKGSNFGYFIASIEDMKKPIAEVVAVAKINPALEVKRLQEKMKVLSLRGGKSDKEVASLKKQIETLQTKMSENESFKGDSLQSINSLDAEIKSLQRGEFTSSIKKAIDDQIEIALLEDEARISDLESGVNRLERTIKEGGKEVDGLKEVVDNRTNFLFFSTALLFVGLVILFVKFRGALKTLPAKQEELKPEPVVDHQEMSITNEESLQPDKLKDLPIGGSVELEFKDCDGTVYYLDVERSAENKVTVYGVLRQLGQQAPLVIDSLEGVLGKIYRAAKGGRVVGLPQLKLVA
jgi:hypothetical protein